MITMQLCLYISVRQTNYMKLIEIWFLAQYTGWGMGLDPFACEIVRVKLTARHNGGHCQAPITNQLDTDNLAANGSNPMPRLVYYIEL